MTTDSGSEINALAIALQWAQLPSEHLGAALRALEPELARQHELKKLEVSRQVGKEKRTFVLYMAGLIAGFLITMGMLTGAVIVGLEGHLWLAAMLSGPSVFALATLFVLRRSDAEHTRRVAESQRGILGAAQAP